MRRIVQVSALPAHVIALCGDGTIWRLPMRGKRLAWEPLPNVPQEARPKPPKRDDEPEPHLVFRKGILSNVYMDATNNVWTENPQRATEYDSPDAAIAAALTIPNASVIPTHIAQDVFDAVIAGPRSRQKIRRSKPRRDAED